MPGRSEREAYNNYAEPLSQVVSCITRVQLGLRGSYKATVPFSAEFVFTNNPASLAGGKLTLFFRQAFHLVYRDQEEDWKVVTDAYEYAIENKQKKELFAYHWDSGGKVSIPHFHLGGLVTSLESDLDRTAHIPTGRVPFEDVIWFLIEELEVPAYRDDWASVIDIARQRFMKFKSW